MTADWVAVTVRGRGLKSRRLGRIGAERLAGLPSLEAAVAALKETPYGREVNVGMGLRAARHAVDATLVWHLRILAGWARPEGVEIIRRLAACFEVANITAHLERVNGRPADPPFILGALSSGWLQIATTRSAYELRGALTASGWGDPGGEDAATVSTMLTVAWLRRMLEGVAEAQRWATAFAALLVARRLARGLPPAPDGAARRHLGAILGSRYENAYVLRDLRAFVPPIAAWVLAGVTEPADLWRAEVLWWAGVEADGFRLCARAQPEPGTVAGLVALLMVDAWRARAALELASRGGGDLTEYLGAAA